MLTIKDWTIKEDGDGGFLIVDEEDGVIATCPTHGDAEQLTIIPELCTKLVDVIEVATMGLVIGVQETEDPARAKFLEACIANIKTVEEWLNAELAGDVSEDHGEK